MDRNKCNNDEPSCTPFHSNGFAVVANGSSMGAVSPESFSERLDKDKVRQTIGKYDQSFLGQQSNLSIRPKPVRSAIDRSVFYHAPAINQNNQRHFSEPPVRKNPFI